MWNESQRDGFGKFCVQLASIEAPACAKFIATGDPDAGVECYCVLPDGSEWGWQAKYFTSTLQDTQWRQIDDSIKTALEKHPRLTRYYVCVPRDRSDARILGRMSEMDRWNRHLTRWQVWAKDRDMNVDFVWWGSSELLDRLSREEHVGRRFFWFNQHEFSSDWFDRRLEEAIETAGPRYTPEVHVDLPIAQDMERFSRSAYSFNEVKALSLEVRRALDSLLLARRSLNQRVDRLALDALSSEASKVMDALKCLEASPSGFLPLPEIVKVAANAYKEGEQVLEHIRQLQGENKTKAEGVTDSSVYYMDPLNDVLHYAYQLQMALQKVIEVCNHFDSLANGQLLIVKGDGGKGKTHLLCDFAKRRIQDGTPTILLMGEKFLKEDDAWTQLLQQLDLSQCSAEVFVGALESAAQASGRRALLMIDALNDGNGRKIWPVHLAAFLVRILRSPWIGVVLSVRSSYEETIIPQGVRDNATIITHHGFLGHEFDATRVFFEHNGLESPSTPILQPEFSNPLFLKAICEGLQGMGERRLPKGFHGITAVFNLYLDAIHERLRNSLDYDPNSNLVRQALERVAKRLAEHDTRRLPRSEAMTIVNCLLPGRDYSRSLYAALVAEGLLTQDMSESKDLSDEVVSITYDRFADHIIADYLIDSYLDKEGADIAFSENGGLSFLGDETKYVRYGLVEALCIQVPERTGKELFRLAPAVLNRPYCAQAFLQSIVWRKHAAFTEDTHAVLDDFLQDEDIWEDFLDIVVSLSIVPNHPFNAEFLDHILRQESMPDRDSWWSTYLHRAWEPQSPVSRLIEWASNLSDEDDIENEVVDLAATILAWMFTTPNRFLRDRATKSLVVLLTGRLVAAGRLVDFFADVDDPYVSERVYAVAYGIAMRSHDADAVGKLSSLVFEQVFASGSPVPHILLRDYARGVVERALYLGVDFPVDISLIHPPYKSVWPDIPDEEIVDALTPNWKQGAWKGGDLEWSRNRIRHSVMGNFLNDFARYVIGTESEPDWLSLRLDEEPWESPKERLAAFLGKLSDAEKEAYGEFKRIDNEPSPSPILVRLALSDEEHDTDLLSREVKQHKGRIEAAKQLLMSKLTEDRKLELESILQAKAVGAPRFDVREIQRYVLWRVFDMGWTIERFGEFDRFAIGDRGREADKPERIGKKYQWIAYHEILAYLSDHYQFRKPSHEDDGDRQYEGPWQLHIRDIDPSATLRSTLGGTWEPHLAGWWGGDEYCSWAEERGHQDWLTLQADIPKVEDLLQAVCPQDRSYWVNLCGRLIWRQPHPVDVDPFELERRELALEWNAYLARSSEVDAFMRWALADVYPPRSLPEPPSLYLYYMFLGEYGWSPAFRHLFSDGDSNEEWSKPGDEVSPVKVWATTVSYISESGVYDCSVDDNYTLHLPHAELLEGLGLRWSGRASDYFDKSDKLAAFDPTARKIGPTALLMNKELLEHNLEDMGQTLFWVVNGEKRIIGGKDLLRFNGRLKISGVYRFTDQGPRGHLVFNLSPPDSIEP